MSFLLDSPEAVSAARRSAEQDPDAFWADIAAHYALDEALGKGVLCRVRNALGALV